MSAAIDFSQPPTVELGRTPSQPSLTHSSTTVSDDNSTARLRMPMTPPMPSSLSRDVSDEHDRAARDLDRWSPSPPPVRETFTDKAAKRLSLSKSLQSLREKAKSDKARRRASSVSEKFKPRPIPTDLPPVPSIPVMYKAEASITGLGVASAHAQQQNGQPSSFSPLQQQRSASNPGPSIPTDARSSAGPSGTRTKPTRKERGLSVFFKKITGRSKKEEPLPGYTRRQYHNTMAEPVGSIGRLSSRMPETMGSLGRRNSRQPVPVPSVAAPARVRGVLAEMETSSAAIQRRHTARKSMIKRVPVPIYNHNPDIDEMEPIADPNDTPAPMDSPVKAADAAEARAAALAALEGGSSSRPRARPVPPRRSPSPCPQSEQQQAGYPPDSEAPVTPSIEAVDIFQVVGGIKHEEEDQQEREARAPLLLSLPTPTTDGETDPDEPVIQTAQMPSPILTQVLVMEPQDVADVGSEHAPALCPSMMIVSRRSFCAPPPINTSFGVVGGSLGWRLPKGGKKLSDFGAFEPGAEAAEGADVVRPLQLRLPLTCSSATAATFGPCTDSNSLRTPHTPVSATSSTFHFDHASQRGCGGAGASSVGHGSVDTAGPSSFARHVPALGHGSSVGHSFDSQPPSPRTPMSVNSLYPPSESHSPRDARFAGSSPARVAAIGEGLVLGSSDSHGRPRSRLRSAGSRLGRKLSTKPKEPPTSYDACVEKQREIAMRRQSCRPTLHSNASIAAEMREARHNADKDTYDTMETFFMS